MKRVVQYGSLFYLVALAAIWGYIRFDTAAWWPLTLFLFSPRWIVAVPLVLFVPLTLAIQWRLVFIYLLHGSVIVFCILGYRTPWKGQTDSNERQVVRVLTCNVGGGSVDIDQLVELTKSHDIHVLMLQECPWSVSLPVFKELGWKHRQEGNVAVGSSFELGELQVLARQSSLQYNAVVAVSCKLSVSDAAPAVQLVNVHFPTFRPALAEARSLGLDAGNAIDSMGALYGDIVERVRQQVDDFDAATIIAGDFNVPVDSAYYRNYWSDYTNAFSEAGTGFGYTKFTRFHGIRIDQVLVDSYWVVNSATVHEGFGGDHRPVLAQLTLIAR